MQQSALILSFVLKKSYDKSLCYKRLRCNDNNDEFPVRGGRAQNIYRSKKINR